jgi:two-component system sensor histidine kinase YesM
MNIVYSNLVKEHFKKDLTPISEETGSVIMTNPERYTSTVTLIDVILAIISSSHTAKQANIYDLDGKMLGAGMFNGELSIKIDQRPWYEETISKNGFKHISLLTVKELPFSIRQHSTTETYLSLSRVYKDGNYVPQGIVEILQDAETVFNSIENFKRANQNLEVYVVDSNDQFFYPYSNSNDGQAGKLYQQLIEEEQLQADTTHHVRSPLDHSKQLMIHTTTNNDLSVIIVQSQEELYSFISHLSYLFIGISAGTFGLILFISFLVSKRVTLPLQTLTNTIKKMDITNFSNAEFFNTDQKSIGEIEALNRSFHSMNLKLSQSLQALLTARAQEMDAKFLALQSQMNPHFLYNNLTNISAMAEAGMNEEIVKLCENMSFMLRYISTESKNGVPLQDELNYTRRYLESMKIRYEDHLSYSIDVPHEMNEIIIPKLTIQPLVENSIKHGLHSLPPWKITVKGAITAQNWTIVISDNGPGFDPNVIKQLHAFYQESDIHSLPELQINGMGIKNIIIRLKLRFQEHTQFEIKNERNGGASITISGPTHMNGVIKE